MRRHAWHHPHLAGYPGYDTVGFGLGNIVHALNPVNIVKAAGSMVATPLQLAYGLGKNVVQTPFKLIGGETRALQNLFGMGGGQGAQPQQPPPGMAPPGFPPGMPPPGFPGSPYSAAAFAPPPMAPPGWPPQPPPPGPGFGMPPMVPPQTPMYDPNQYLAATAPPAMDTMSLYGGDTGWNAAYGGGAPDGAGW